MSVMIAMFMLAFPMVCGLFFLACMGHILLMFYMVVFLFLFLIHWFIAPHFNRSLFCSFRCYRQP